MDRQKGRQWTTARQDNLLLAAELINKPAVMREFARSDMGRFVQNLEGVDNAPLREIFFGADGRNVKTELLKETCDDGTPVILALTRQGVVTISQLLNEPELFELLITKTGNVPLSHILFNDSLLTVDDMVELGRGEKLRELLLCEADSGQSLIEIIARSSCSPSLVMYYERGVIEPELFAPVERICAQRAAYDCLLYGQDRDVIFAKGAYRRVNERPEFTTWGENAEIYLISEAYGVIDAAKYREKDIVTKSTGKEAFFGSNPLISLYKVIEGKAEPLRNYIYRGGRSEERRTTRIREKLDFLNEQLKELGLGDSFMTKQEAEETLIRLHPLVVPGKTNKQETDDYNLALLSFQRHNLGDDILTIAERLEELSYTALAPRRELEASVSKGRDDGFYR